MTKIFILAVFGALLSAEVNAQNVDTQQLVQESRTQSEAVTALARQTVASSEASVAKAETIDQSALKQAVQGADAAKQKYLQAMYQKNLPDEAKKAKESRGERILMFASMSMGPVDMHGLLEAAAADPRIVIKFLGGEKQGGVAALVHWINQLSKGMNIRPNIEIDPPAFHKYNIKEVPFAVILKDGQEAARVGGVYSTKWMDDQLRSRSGDLGSYGRMSLPIEDDMQVLMHERVAHFDWESYKKVLRSNFWRMQQMPAVPHATQSQTYDIDPTITLTHDIVLPNGTLIAHAGQKANPLALAPLKTTLLVIDGSDETHRAYARQFVKDSPGKQVMVLSTTVPAAAADGWSVWSDWQKDVGTHLFAYSKAMADRFRLTGTPSVVTGDGLLIKVTQIALGSKENN